MGTQQGLSQAAEEQTLAAGTVLSVYYRVVQLIGPASFGTLYLGEHIQVKSRVAIRVLSAQWKTWVRSEEDVERFRRAVRDPSQTCHPNIAQVFDAGRLGDGRLYMITELLLGHNLYEEIQQHQYLPVVRACRILRDVGRAVRAAHEVGLIHRDLKADNVMLVPLPGVDGEAIQVLDFGIAAWAEVEARKTSPGVFVATPEYMAPEQVQGKPATPLFDIYALGVMLFEALVGEPPFAGTNGAFILKSKVARAAPSLAQKLPGMPRRLIELVDDCLLMDPTLRPQSAREFLVRIDEILRTLQRLSGPTPI